MHPVKLLSFTLMLAGIFLAGKATAQIKIGTNGSIIAPSSLLELESANQGLLLPRMADTVAINGLNPPSGMLIYLTKTPAVGLYVRKVTGWEYLTGSLGGNGNFTSLTVSGSITAGNFSGPLTGNATSATTAVTATNAINSAVTDDLNNTAVVFPTFVTTSPGNTGLRTSSTNLRFVPNTGILTALGFSGPLTGNVTGTATQAIDATNAANVAVINDVTSNATFYPTFVSGTNGNLPQRTSSARFTFNPSSGLLTAGSFNGIWNGTVIGSQFGGTGVNNQGRTLTLQGNLSLVGTSAVILRSSGPTDVILPTSGEILAGIRASPTLDFTPVAAYQTQELTTTVSGAVDGDAVVVGIPSAVINLNTSFTAWVSAPNIVTVRITNNSLGVIDPLPNTYNIRILK